MTEEIELIYSPLQQTYTKDGETVDIQIYRSPDSGWTLEVVDKFGNSTVWDAEFETDQEALDQGHVGNQRRRHQGTDWPGTGSDCSLIALVTSPSPPAISDCVLQTGLLH